MMESLPASPFEMSQAEFALQFLVVAFDAPSQLDDVAENRERHILGQGREPVFGWLRLALRPFDDETFDGMRRHEFVVTRGRPDPRGGEARRQRLVLNLGATRRPSRPRRAGVLQALWPKPADDRRRVAGAKACAPGRSRLRRLLALRTPAPRARAPWPALPCPTTPTAQRSATAQYQSLTLGESAKCGCDLVDLAQLAQNCGCGIEKSMR